MVKKASKLSLAFLYDDSLDSNDGVAQQVKTLGQWLSAKGHKVSYLVGQTELESWAGGRVYSLARNVTVTFNGNKMSVPLLARKAAIKEALAEVRPDVIHVQTPYSPLLASRVIGAAPGTTAVVGTFHILPVNRLAVIGSRLLGIATFFSRRRFDEMVSVSAPAVDFAKRAFGFDSAVVPNTVDVSRFQVKKPSLAAASAKKIVFLGRLVERKGAKYLIEAFAKLPDSLNTRLVIAGKGPQLEYLEGLARSLGVAERVEFPGFIAEEDKPRLLAGADIACFPSTGGESFGIVLIEAMAAGAKVVLGGDNLGYRSVLGDQPDQLVKPTDISQFAQRLEKFLTDESAITAAQSWQAGQVQRYDVNAVGNQLLAVYRRAIDKRKGFKA